MWQQFSNKEFTIENIKKQYFLLGVSLKIDWIQQMINSGIDDFSLLETYFLKTNINITSEPNREFSDFMKEYSVTNQDFIVQIDEVVDVGLPYIDRIEMKRSPNGTLKFLLNSGGTQFIGLEKTKLGSEFAIGRIVPGTKILVSKGSEMRYGVLFLTNENTHIIGGKADDLLKQRKFIYENIPPDDINSQMNVNSQPSQEYYSHFSIPNFSSEPAIMNKNDKKISNTIDLPELFSDLQEDHIYYCKAKVVNILCLYLDGDNFIYTVAVGSPDGGSIRAIVDQKYTMKLLEVSSSNEWRNLDDFDVSIRQENANATLLNRSPPIKLIYKPQPKFEIDFILLE